MENTLPWGGEVQTQDVYYQNPQDPVYQTPYYTYEPANSQQYGYQDPYYPSQCPDLQQPAYQTSYYPNTNSGSLQYGYQDPYYSNQYTYLQQSGYQYPCYSNEHPSSQQYGNDASYYSYSNNYPYTQEYAVISTEKSNSEVNKNKEGNAPMKNVKRDLQNRVLKNGNQTTNFIAKNKILENRSRGSREGIRRVNLQNKGSLSSDKNRVPQRTMLSSGVPPRNTATSAMPAKNTVTSVAPPKTIATPGITPKPNAMPRVPARKPSTHEASQAIAPKKVLSKQQQEVMSATAETVAAVKAEAAAAAATIANSVRRKLPPTRSLLFSPTRFFANTERGREERQRPSLTLPEETQPPSERDQALDKSPGCFKTDTAQVNVVARQSSVAENKKNEILTEADISAKFKYLAEDCKAFADFLYKIDNSEEEESSDVTSTSNTSDEREAAETSSGTPIKTTPQTTSSDTTKKSNLESRKKGDNLKKKFSKNPLEGKITSLLGNARRISIKPKITKTRHIAISKRDNLHNKTREIKVRGAIVDAKVRKNVLHDKGMAKCAEIDKNKENSIVTSPITQTGKIDKSHRTKQVKNQTDDESSGPKLKSSVKNTVKMTTLSQQRSRIVHENIAREKLLNERSQQLREYKSSIQTANKNAHILPFSVVCLGQEPTYAFAKKIKYENSLFHNFSNMSTTKEKVQETRSGTFANNLSDTDVSPESNEVKAIGNVKSDDSFLPPIEERPTTVKSYQSLPAQGSRGSSRNLDLRKEQRMHSNNNSLQSPCRFALRSPSNAPSTAKSLANLGHRNSRAVGYVSNKDSGARLPPLSREKKKSRESNGNGSSVWHMSKKLLPPIIDKLFKRRSYF